MGKLTCVWLWCVWEEFTFDWCKIARCRRCRRAAAAQIAVAAHASAEIPLMNRPRIDNVRDLLGQTQRSLFAQWRQWWT